MEILESYSVHPVDEDIAEITKNLTKYGGERIGTDILAVAAGVVIGIVIWFVVLKGTA